jgi:hypothetical protein
MLSESELMSMVNGCERKDDAEVRALLLDVITRRDREGRERGDAQIDEGE